mgnify:CR=1 FL=1
MQGSGLKNNTKKKGWTQIKEGTLIAWYDNFC